MVFFGTPHNGGQNYQVWLGTQSARIVRRLYGNQGPRDLMQALQSGSIYSNVLQEQWRHQLNLFKIVSFYETVDSVGTPLPHLAYS